MISNQSKTSSKPCKLEVAIYAAQRSYYNRRILLLFVGVLLLSPPLTSLISLPFIWSFTITAVVAVVAFYLAALKIIPTKIVQRHQLQAVLWAAKNPRDLLSSSPKKITIKTTEGKVELDKAHRKLWYHYAVPFLSDQCVSESRQPKEAPLMSGERSHVLEQYQEIARKKQEIRSAQAALFLEKEEIRNEAETLKNAEVLVIERLTQIETAEAEVLQLKENTISQQSTTTAEALTLKEQELRELQSNLEEDRRIVEQQKTDLNTLKGEFLQQAASPSQNSYGNSESTQQASQKESDLAEREAYIQQVEEDLIAQLHSLSEREAHVEQSEIAAGLRSDT